MNKIIGFLIVCSFAFNTSYAQKSLNDYKYVIVPNRYDFFDEDDKYRLNALTKFLFKKYGFDALMVDQPFPEDLQNDNCLALKANVINHRGMLKTKLEVELRDCSNGLVYNTQIGVSRVKEYKKAYNLALRNAFESFDVVNYKYSGNTSAPSKKKPEAKVEEVKVAPVKEMKQIKPKKNPKTPQVIKEDKITTTEANTQKAIVNKQEKELEKIETAIKTINQNTFTTKEIFNGYKLLDNNAKEVMTIFNSGMKDVFIVKGKDAIIYMKGDKWIYSETNETNLLTKLIKINF